MRGFHAVTIIESNRAVECDIMLRHEYAADQIFVKKVLDTERMFCYTHVSPIFRTYVSYIPFTMITARAEIRLHMHVGVL